MRVQHSSKRCSASELRRNRSQTSVPYSLDTHNLPDGILWSSDSSLPAPAEATSLAAHTFSTEHHTSDEYCVFSLFSGMGEEFIIFMGNLPPLSSEYKHF